MANPIRRANRESDPLNEGQRQDRERRERDDQAYYERTGQHRPPIHEYSPLVDDDRPDDVATDGDSYVEDSPSEIIDATPHLSEMIRDGTERNRIVNEKHKESKTKKRKEREDLQKSIEESREQMGNTIEGLDI